MHFVPRERNRAKILPAVIQLSTLMGDSCPLVAAVRCLPSPFLTQMSRGNDLALRKKYENSSFHISAYPFSSKKLHKTVVLASVFNQEMCVLSWAGLCGGNSSCVSMDRICRTYCSQVELAVASV